MGAAAASMRDPVKSTIADCNAAAETYILKTTGQTQLVVDRLRR